MGFGPWDRARAIPTPPDVRQRPQPGDASARGSAASTHAGGMRDHVMRILAVQGDVSRAQLGQLGVADAEVQALVTAGVICRIGRGTYGLPLRDGTPEESHRRLAAAVLTRHRGRAVLSHHSALAEVGLPLHGVPFNTAHITSLRGARYRRRSDHVLHAADVSTRPLAGADPPRHVQVGHALVQTGLRWGAEALLPAADQALRRSMITPRELAQAVADYAHSPGMSQVRPAVAAADPKAESVGESLLRWQVLLLGYPVQTQVDPGCPGHSYRMDLVIPGHRIALEFDGIDKYAPVLEQRDDTVCRALRAEKARDEDLRAAGWYVIHFTWPELFRPTIIAARIEAAIAWLARAA